MSYEKARMKQQIKKNQTPGQKSPSVRWNSRAVGASYEQEAGAYLERKGYQVLEYNFRCKGGEIDLIARDGATIVFCEVKYRRDGAKGHPYEAVTFKKQRTISRCALAYLCRTKRTGAACRFDVISIEGGKWAHYRNAFPYAG